MVFSFLYFYGERFFVGTLSQTLPRKLFEKSFFGIFKNFYKTIFHKSFCGVSGCFLGKAS